MFIASECQLQHEAPLGAKWISLLTELDGESNDGPINISLLTERRMDSTTALF
jgi:hypothetical protein